MIQSALELRETSLIEYAQRELSLGDRSRLRAQPYLSLFLELILRPETRGAFPLRQYWFAVNFITGAPTKFTDSEAVFVLENLSRRVGAGQTGARS